MIANSKKRAIKVNYNLELNQLVWDNMKKYLNELGVVSDKDIQNFMRGAVIAGVQNAMRAEDKNWKAFMKAIQPIAKKHLGIGLTDDGVKGILDCGVIS